MGGGTLRLRTWGRRRLGLSPRGRGNHNEGVGTGEIVGSIPAWAGEPVASITWNDTLEVYPRVGGGTHGHDGLVVPWDGLSPRGRGNHSRDSATCH